MRAATDQIHEPILSCKEQLRPTTAGVNQRPASDGSDCSTEEAFDPTRHPRKPRLSLVLESAGAEAQPDAEALRMLRTHLVSAGSKRSRAPRTNTPSPVSEEGSATSAGLEGSSHASKRDREHEEVAGDAKGDPKGRRASNPWTAEEDGMLQRAVVEVGPKRWSAYRVGLSCNPNPNPTHPGCDLMPTGPRSRWACRGVAASSAGCGGATRSIRA